MTLRLKLVEGVFMFAVLAGYWLFSAFIDPRDPGSALTETGMARPVRVLARFVALR